MGSDCGHDCCAIRRNTYHAHRRPPQDCAACAGTCGPASGERMDATGRTR